MSAKTVTLGLRLRMVLASRRWTQADLAAYLGVSQSAVSRWLSGSRVPRQRRVRAWLLDLGVDPKCL